MPSQFHSNNTNQDFASKYIRQNILTRYLVNNFFSSLRKEIHPLPLDNALEIGCGEGLSTRRLLDQIPSTCRIEACDVEPRLVEAARLNNPGIHVQCASVYNLPYESNVYDLVVVLEVLEHLHSPEEALVEICRVSKKWILLSVPREPLWSILNMTRLKYLNSWGNTPGHIQHWSARDFISFVSRRAQVVHKRNPLPWTIVLARKSLDDPDI